MRIFVFIPVLILLAGCYSTRRSRSDQDVETVLQLRPGPENPRNSEGDFIQLKDGRWLFVYTRFTGGGGDHSRAHLAGCYSKDQGRSWFSQQHMVLPNEGEMNIMSVSLLRLDNGNIALFYLRKNSTSDCIPYMRISTDEAGSWGEAIRCIQDEAYYVLNNDRAVQLKSGRILLPVANHSWGQYREFRSRARIECFYSDDRGRSWYRSAEAENPEEVISQEPGVVELKDGSILLFCRTDAGVQYTSRSEDGGQTWSSLQPSRISSPLSPASVERIPSTGDLLAVWNNNLSKKEGLRQNRTPLTMAISKDEGRSWERVKNIQEDPEGWYCYTAIAFTERGLLLAYCSDDLRESKRLSTTRITRISNKWIYNKVKKKPEE
ncbi:MAG: sialidase family protein [Bacteroidota bacterium]